MVNRIWHAGLLLTVLTFGAATPARAEIIVIDPNAYAIGTSLSTLFPGLTMTHLPTGGDVSVGGVSYAGPAGGHSIGAGWYSSADVYNECLTRGAGGACEPWNVLELVFAAPTDYVQMLGGWWSDQPLMYAYDAAGTLISQCGAYSGGIDCSTAMLLSGTGVNGSSVASLTIAREERDIARIVFGGQMGNAAALQVSYGVPEPATLGVLLVGLAGAGLARFRGRR